MLRLTTLMNLTIHVAYPAMTSINSLQLEQIKLYFHIQVLQPNPYYRVYDVILVKWEESDIRWASRWDTYLEMGDVQIHWFSIINSIVVVFFLAGILAMIIGNIILL